MSAPDASELFTVQKRLKSACKNLHLMAPEVGMARQLIDYDSDRRRNLLARYMVKHLKNGESVSAAENYARSDEGYQNELHGLAGVLEQAYGAVKRWDAEMASWESSRSLLSLIKETMKTLPGTED